MVAYEETWLAEYVRGVGLLHFQGLRNWQSVITMHVLFLMFVHQ